MPNPVGRPTTCTPELIEKAYEYLSGAWNHGDAVIPSHIGLGKYLGVNRRILYKWAEKEEDEDEENKDLRCELKHILAECNEEQEDTLMNGALKGDLNSNIAKLALGKHGFSEKNSTEVSGPGGGPVDMKWVVEIVDVKE